jgi:hypothetical protein
MRINVVFLFLTKNSFRKLAAEREQNHKKQLSKHIPETIQGW